VVLSVIRVIWFIRVTSFSHFARFISLIRFSRDISFIRFSRVIRVSRVIVLTKPLHITHAHIRKRIHNTMHEQLKQVHAHIQLHAHTTTRIFKYTRTHCIHNTRTQLTGNYTRTFVY
jgi:hypothetical protein